MSISELYRSFSKAIPLVEENDERCSRPIFLKHCSVEFNPSNKNSWRKSFLSKATRPFRHWALEIGNYSYDLRVGERQMSRYVVSQIPNSEAARAFEFNVRVLWHEHGKWTVRKGCKEGKAVQIGSTTMTDLEINEIGKFVLNFHVCHTNIEKRAKSLEP